MRGVCHASYENDEFMLNCPYPKIQLEEEDNYPSGAISCEGQIDQERHMFNALFSVHLFRMFHNFTAGSRKFAFLVLKRYFLCEKIYVDINIYNKITRNRNISTNWIQGKSGIISIENWSSK